MLSDQELIRYSRHIIMPEVGLEGQEKLKKARILVVGAGGLGCPALLYLTAAGVGEIGIIDFDIVDESNLHRQVLFAVEDIGKSKAIVAQEKLSAQNTYIKINVYREFLNKENALDIIGGYDIVIDGTDNFATRYLINDSCVLRGKPFVYGSIFKFEGQVSVFNYCEGPTYRCLFPEPPDPGSVPNCAETGVLGVLPGIVGCLQANEAIKIITGLGEPLSGKLLVFDALKMSFTTMQFLKDELQSKVKGLVDYDSFCNYSSANKKNADISDISVYELKKLMDSGENIQIIDVREPAEYKICNLGGILIPFSQIEQNIHQISKEKKVIFHCHHGGRSSKALTLLRDKYGFQNLCNLKGGIHSWALEIDKDMTKY